MKNDTRPEARSPRQNVRLEDLAQHAGVSIATISRALNDSPAVNDETKKRVWKLARELGYAFRPHMPVMMSTANKTITVALPKPTGREGKISDPFYMQLVAGISEAARDADCNVLVTPDTPQNFDELHDFVASNRTDGIIFLGQGHLHERFNRLSDKENRYIVWGADIPGQRYCSVGSDNVAGGRLATSHLIRLGRRAIAFLGNADAPEVAQRREGYEAALSAAGIPVRPELIKTTDFEFEAAAAAISDLLHGPIELDGIVAAGDVIAIGAHRALKAAGKSVPKDISIVGYDDLLISRYHNPALTTISQDMNRAGRIMVSKLLHGNDRSVLVSERLPTELVVRESCGASHSDFTI